MQSKSPVESPKNSRVPLTNAVAKAAPLPPRGDYILRDSANRTTGLALRVYATGTKIWIVQKKVGRVPRRFVIGPFPDFSHREAVDKAVEVSAKVRSGIDPRLEAKARAAATEEALDRQKLTVEKAFVEYCKERPTAKASTQKDRDRAQKLLAPGALWRTPLFDVKGADLVLEFNRLKRAAKSKAAANSGATQAGKIFRTVRAVFKRTYMVHEPEKANPFDHFNKLEPGWYRVRERQRIVAAAEGDLQRWWSAVESLRANDAPQAADKNTMADYLLLSLLFGGRSSETRSLRWSDVDLRSGVVTFPGDVTKSKRAHQIPFGPYARDILERRKSENDARDEPSRYVFNASRRGRSKKTDAGEIVVGERTYIKEPKKSVAKVVADAGIPFSPHDIRRTFATLFEEMGVSTIAVERALNHRSQSTAGKHYVHGRLRALRTQYENLEAQILAEAGVQWPPSANATSPKKRARARAGEW